MPSSRTAACALFVAAGIRPALGLAADPAPQPSTPLLQATAPADPPSVVIAPEKSLEFEVHLAPRSLRDPDPRFEELQKKLPDMETHRVPFKKGWTEELRDAFVSQLRNGPPPCKPDECELEEQKARRMHQMDTDFGPQDDWTWTPPSR